VTTIHIRQATSHDANEVISVLHEAAQWLEQSGNPLWRADELTPARITAEIADDCFFLAERNGAVAGVLKFQLEDPQFWPDVPPGEAAFVHRLAVRRSFAGGEISAVLLNWAIDRAKNIGRHYLRLDCEASRVRLRAIYERAGFRHHSDREVGPYFVSRYEFPL
jgi:GNAT superfamily N-acetyltransferase